MREILTGKILLAALLAWLAPAALFAQDTAPAVETNPLGLAMTRQHAENFEPGKPFEVTVTISAATAGQVTAMGLRETLPPEWKLEGVSGADGAPPDVSPAPGATGLLEFAWIAVPQFPCTFTYAITPPEGDGGTKVIHGALEYRELGGAHFAAPVITEAHGPDAKPPTITLKGANPVTLNVGDAWQEPGYTALDGKNQDITGKVAVGGTVDTGRAAEYGLTYTVSTDDGQHTAVSRNVVVKEKEDTQATPTAGRPGAAPLREPGPSGRERSNPIAASAGKNPGNQAQDGAAPAAPGAEGEAGQVVKRPELPDLSAFRPPPTPQPEDKPVPLPGAAALTPTIPGASAVSIPSVPHRAPVPPEMLKAAALKEKALKATASASAAASVPVPEPPSPALKDASMLTAAAVAAVVLVLLGGVGLLGWRLVYSRPVRRKRPPSPPSR